MKALETGAADRFIVEFTTKADLTGASRIKDRTQRGQTVFNALRKTTATSQVVARTVVGRTSGARAESFWLSNVMLVHGDAALATKLAALPTVRKVRLEKVYPLVKPIAPQVVVEPASRPSGASPRSARTRSGPRGSPARAWSSPRSTPGSSTPTRPSSSTTAATTTTARSATTTTGGIRPASAATRPCDNAGHGTHTMGTIVGGDLDGPLPDIGVAPGASGSRPRAARTSTAARARSCRPASSSSPRPTSTGNNPDVSKRPDIVSNSWGNDDPNDQFYLADGRRLAGGRDHPGVRGRERRTGLRQRRLARAVHRGGHQRRRDRQERPDRRLLVARPVAERQGQPERLGARGGRRVERARATATKP